MKVGGCVLKTRDRRFVLHHAAAWLGPCYCLLEVAPERYIYVSAGRFSLKVRW